MAWKLTNGDFVFVTIHDECPTDLGLFIMDCVSHFIDVPCDDDVCDVCEVCDDL